MDVEAESDGVILRTLVTEGTEVEVGTAIAVLARPDETVDDVDAALAALGRERRQRQRARAGHPSRRPRPRAGRQRRAPPVRQPARPPARRRGRAAGHRPGRHRPGGRIVRRDVEAALAQRVAHEEADLHDASPALPGRRARARGAGPPARRRSAAGRGGYTDQPLSRMRKAVAARLTESKTTAPHFYVRGVARVDALLQLRADLNDGADVRSLGERPPREGRRRRRTSRCRR